MTALLLLALLLVTGFKLGQRSERSHHEAVQRRHDELYRSMRAAAIFESHRRGVMLGRELARRDAERMALNRN